LDKPPDAVMFHRAAEAAVQEAHAQSQNGFKIELAKRCVKHALSLATQTQATAAV
jgi:xanthine dehydrogenase YagS FAD-binding subunit